MLAWLVQLHRPLVTTPLCTGPSNHTPMCMPWLPHPNVQALEITPQCAGFGNHNPMCRQALVTLVTLVRLSPGTNIRTMSELGPRPAPLMAVTVTPYSFPPSAGNVSESLSGPTVSDRKSLFALRSVTSMWYPWSFPLSWSGALHVISRALSGWITTVTPFGVPGAVFGIGRGLGGCG